MMICTKEEVQDYLWEKVTNEIEKTEQLSNMIKGIPYLDDVQDIIYKTKFCEVLMTEDFQIIEFKIKKDAILVSFNMDYILSVWSETQQLLRITGYVNGKCIVVNKGSQLNTDITELRYTDVECDDIRVV